MSNPNPAIYFKSLTIENIRCFKTEQTLDFTNSKGEPALFTVILGNNNMGKTTLLKILGSWEERTEHRHYEENEDVDTFIYVYNTADESLKLSNDSGLMKINLLENIDGSYKIINKISQIDPTHFKPITFQREIFIMGGLIAMPTIMLNEKKYMSNFMIDGYGVNRSKGELNISNYNLDKLEDRTESLFSDNAKLLNAEDFLLRTFISTNPSLNNAEKATTKLNKIKATILELFKSAGTTQAGNLEFISNDKLETNVFFTTEFGDKVRLNDLGAGYQSLITWVVDLAHRMFMRYPEAENPLAEPAIVLVDELDLHLHPEWQRKVVGYLRTTFPKTQFIVTAHSPLIVQSEPNLNVILLQKDEEKDSVNIVDANVLFNTETFEGWTLEEIMKYLMDMNHKTSSNKYNELRKGFEEALDDNNYEQAKHFYDEIAKLSSSPSSVDIDIMQLRMTAISPNRKSKQKDNK